MAQNKSFRFGPVAMSNAVGNLLNPPAASGGVNAGASSQYILLKKVRVTNKTAAAATFNLYLGATGGSAAGTELAVAKSVPANDAVEIWFGGNGLRVDAADFLTGNASALTTLVIQGDGEIGVAG